MLVTFSAGIAFVDRKGPESAFDAAAVAMRRAKGSGRNRLEVADAADFLAAAEAAAAEAAAVEAAVGVPTEPTPGPEGVGAEIAAGRRRTD